MAPSSTVHATAPCALHGGSLHLVHDWYVPIALAQSTAPWHSGRKAKRDEKIELLADSSGIVLTTESQLKKQGGSLTMGSSIPHPLRLLGVSSRTFYFCSPWVAHWARSGNWKWRDPSFFFLSLFAAQQSVAQNPWKGLCCELDCVCGHKKEWKKKRRAQSTERIELWARVLQRQVNAISSTVVRRDFFIWVSKSPFFYFTLVVSETSKRKEKKKSKKKVRVVCGLFVFLPTDIHAFFLLKTNNTRCMCICTQQTTHDTNIHDKKENRNQQKRRMRESLYFQKLVIGDKLCSSLLKRPGGWVHQ